MLLTSVSGAKSIAPGMRASSDNTVSTRWRLSLAPRHALRGYCKAGSKTFTVEIADQIAAFFDTGRVKRR